MRSPGLTAAAWSLFDWRGLMHDSMVSSSMGVVFFLVPPLWELCFSLVQPIDGTRLGNVFSEEAGDLEGMF